MKNYIFLILLLFVTLSCSDKVGGIKSDISITKFIKNSKLIKEYLSEPKKGKKVTFKIIHENIDLKGYDIIISSSSDPRYFYYGSYQKEITAFFPDYNKKDCTELTFSILDKKKDLMYYYKSNLCYYILEAKKDIKVKLLGEYQTIEGEEINYKLTGCRNRLDD